MSARARTLFGRPAERARCPGCDALVVAVHLLASGEVLLVEPHELECPRLECPACSGTGVGRSRDAAEHGPFGRCLRCSGTGRVGDPVPTAAVAVSERGGGRRWRRGYPRRTGEALMRRHVCG